MIVPVAIAHVGCVTVVVGALGNANAALITERVAVDTHELELSFTLTWYVPVAKAFDVAAAWKVVPLSKLYVTPLDGSVTVIVPVVAPQMGWATVPPKTIPASEKSPATILMGYVHLRSS